MTLDELRERIDALDRELVRLLDERAGVVLDVGVLKKKIGIEAYAPEREKAVLERVCRITHRHVTDAALRAIYREIMSASLAAEKGVRVAYLGPPATSVHEAARLRFGQSVEYVPCSSVREIFSMVEDGVAEYGVVPRENSVDGTGATVLPCFIDSGLRISAEIVAELRLHLLSRGLKERVRRVYAHPYALGLCRQWLRRKLPAVELLPVASSPAAAEMASREADTAAIAGDLAAELYGLKSVAGGIDNATRFARFVILGRNAGKMSGDDKTSIVFAVDRCPGSLCRILEQFQAGGINVIWLESVPDPSGSADHYIFVDIEGHEMQPNVEKALAGIREHCRKMKILGSYPRSC